MTLFQLAVTIFGLGLAILFQGPVAAFAQTAENFAESKAESRLDRLFQNLRAPGEGWRLAETEIMQIWSSSGSAAMDLLLKRGIEALDAGDLDAAIGHLTALTDHAPDFAEGWAARASAYALAGLPGPASSDIARALLLEPRHFAALTLLCQMLEEMDDEARAEAACQASLAIHPHQQEAIDSLARLRHRRDGTLM